MESISINSKQRNVLIVESDRELIASMEDYIVHHEVEEKNHIKFTFAQSAKEALKKLAELRMDLVVTEIILPIVNGYYLIKAIKKENKDLPIIIYTQLKGPQDLAKMSASEVDNIFVKPLMKMEDLIQIIINHDDHKAELDKVLVELQSQIKSISDSDEQAHVKVITCPRCNMILTRDSKFCNNCGQKVTRTHKAIHVKTPEELIDKKESSEMDQGAQGEVKSEPAAEKEKTVEPKKETNQAKTSAQPEEGDENLQAKA